MNTTKKILAILMVTMLLVSAVLLTGCGSKGSGLSIDKLQQVMAKQDEELAFEKTQNGEGYTFSYTKDSSVTAVAYTGEADADENVTSVTITNEKVKASVLTDASELRSVMSKSSGDMTMNDVRVGMCILQVVYLREACGADDNDQSIADMLDDMAALFSGTAMTVGDWTITATTQAGEKGSTVTITATCAAN